MVVPKIGGILEQPRTSTGLESLLANEAGTENLTLQQQQPPTNDDLESVSPSDTQNEQEQ